MFPRCPCSARSLGSGEQEIAFLHRALKGPPMSVQFSEIKGLKRSLFSPKAGERLICFIKMTPLVPCPHKANQELPGHCQAPPSVLLPKKGGRRGSSKHPTARDTDPRQQAQSPCHPRIIRGKLAINRGAGAALISDPQNLSPGE